MGLFGSYKPKVSKREFREARSLLRAKGFSQGQVNDIAQVFRGDLEEALSGQQGIDKAELARGTKWLRANKSRHSLSSKQIDTLERILKEKL